MLYLSDFSTEHLINSSLALFKQNLNPALTNSSTARYLENAKVLLQQEIYPKLIFLAGMISEPLEFNEIESVNLESIQRDLKYYRFDRFESLLFIAFKNSVGYVFIFGDIQFDGTIKLEWYGFDINLLLRSVQNHHLKAFEIASDFGTRKQLNSSLGAHLFSSSDQRSHSTRHKSDYVNSPLTTTVNVMHDNPFKEIMK